MITDKDKEEAKAYLEKLFSGKTGTGSWHGINDKWSESELVEMQAERDSRIRAESADQARKEAAERAVAFLKKEWYWFNDDACYADELLDAILGDSTTDQIHAAVGKLAIAVKALEKINERHSFADIVDDSYIISRDALREIQ